MYRECVVPATVFRRLLELGASNGLRSLASLDVPGPHTLDKNHARKLARDVAAIEAAVPSEPELAAIAEIARWCARATDTSWLTIVGPQAHGRR